MSNDNKTCYFGVVATAIKWEQPVSFAMFCNVPFIGALRAGCDVLCRVDAFALVRALERKISEEVCSIGAVHFYVWLL